MERRSFIKNSALAILATRQLTDFAPSSIISKPNALPEWRGFNLTDFSTPFVHTQWRFTSDEHLKWIADWGFDFIRLPLAYPYYLVFDPKKNITPEQVYHINESAVENIERLVFGAQRYGIHVSLNLHRAPGYCINAGFREPYNLWKDAEAQKAFYFHWGFWAKRFKSHSPQKISFDLLNEPSFREDMNDQLSPTKPVPVDLYRRIVENAVQAIRAESPNRLIIADGNYIGNDPVPELADLNIAQSCRGYFPHSISHYKAPWANSDPEGMAVPVYPGKIGNQQVNRQSLEEYYRPWIELKNSGVGIHCGECGSWNKTPHHVFLNWFSDVIDILSSHKIGFALWEFMGDFGILNSGRHDVNYEDWYGQKLDRKLLQLIQKK